MNIGIIGAGNMGGAIARGLYRQAEQWENFAFSPKDIIVSDLSETCLNALKQDCPDICISKDNVQAAACDIVLLAVKPWLVDVVLREIAEQLNEKKILIVVAAGVSFEQIFKSLPETLAEMPCYRLIPNTAITEMESMNLFAAINCEAAQNTFIFEVFGHLGTCMMLDEDKMAAATSLTSCGIAYALRYIRASVQAAVEMGFRPADAQAMVAQTVKGAAELLLNNDTTAENEIDKVTTPGGITIKGLNELEANGFSNAIIKGLKASR